jgi:hypothetical protein
MDEFRRALARWPLAQSGFPLQLFAATQTGCRPSVIHERLLQKGVTALLLRDHRNAAQLAFAVTASHACHDFDKLSLALDDVMGVCSGSSAHSVASNVQSCRLSPQPIHRPHSMGAHHPFRDGDAKGSS